eukprot:10955811-Alexandrium_andersonii.AAC.1
MAARRRRGPPAAGRQSLGPRCCWEVPRPSRRPISLPGGSSCAGGLAVGCLATCGEGPRAVRPCCSVLRELGHGLG